MLSQKQTEIIKEHIIKNIEKNFPPEKKAFAIKQIEAMNSEELEEFLKKNEIKLGDIEKSSQCIFCSIVKGEIDSYKVDEDNNSIAVLEINPLSKGHILVITKEHGEKETKSLVESVSKMINKKLKPKEILIGGAELFGHHAINVIPVYGEEKPEKRYPAKPEELLELQKILSEKNKKDKSEKIRIKKVKKITLDAKKIWLPKRIP